MESSEMCCPHTIEPVVSGTTGHCEIYKFRRFPSDAPLQVKTICQQPLQLVEEGRPGRGGYRAFAVLLAAGGIG